MGFQKSGRPYLKGVFKKAAYTGFTINKGVKTRRFFLYLCKMWLNGLFGYPSQIGPAGSFWMFGYPFEIGPAGSFTDFGYPIQIGPAGSFTDIGYPSQIGPAGSFTDFGYPFHCETHRAWNSYI